MKILSTFKYILFCLTLLVLTNNLQSQNIVVSEYFNTTDAKDEWIELLVIKDNYNAVGISVRDNVENADDPGNPNKWMGGVIFSNHSLWKNLRAGTVIVINSRGDEAVDTDPTDGYIEIGAENSTYFDKICFNCNELNWAFDALVIAEKGDLVQILDVDQVTNIHTLGHITQPPKVSGDFNDITGPKLARWSECPIDASVRITPGDKLSVYSVVDGFDSGNSLTSCSASNITKGLANKSVGAQTDINQRFWRDIREPRWDSPTLTATQVGTTTKLVWNKPMVDVFSNDNSSGYLIMKVKTQFSANQIHPEDGTEYKVGDVLGFGIVVGVVIGSQTLEFTDVTKTDCGDDYLYRVYAFRYNNGGQTFNPLTGRGRSYFTQNNGFAEAAFSKEAPPSFTIDTKDKITNFCDLDTALIINDIPKELRSSYKFTWYRENNVILRGSDFGLNDSIVIRQSGRYRLDIENLFGCIVSSNILNIVITKQPKIVLRNDRDASFLTKDTTIYLCAGQTFIFNSSGNGEKKEWFKDGVSVNPNAFTFTTKENGTYKVVYSNQNACFDSSAAITLKFLEYDLDFSDKNLEIIIPATDNQVDAQFKIKNNKNDLISLDGFNLRIEPLSNYEILEKPPYILPANGEITLTIRFKLTNDGRLPGRVIIDDPCQNKDTINLDGKKLKAQTTYTLSMEEINFIPTLICETKKQDTTLTITNIGNVPLDIETVNVNAPFSLTNSPLPTTIPIGGALDITVSFDANSIDTYNENLIFNCKTLEGPFTIEIPLAAEINVPKYLIFPDEVDFKTLSDCELTRDTTIFIVNNGLFDITFDKQLTNPSLEILNLPISVEAGKTAEVKLRIRPVSNGVISFNENFVATPCDVKSNLKVDAAKDGVIYSLANDTIDFGIIVNCNEGITPTLSNNLNIQIPNGLEVTITNIEISNGFSTNLAIGQKLESTNDINITLNETLEGIYIGKVKLTLDPCNAELEFDLKAERQNYSLTLPDTVYFSPVYQLETSNNYIVIDNQNKYSIIVKEIKGLNTNFKLRSDMILPKEFASMTADTLWLEYSNTQYKLDTLVVTYESEVPCNINKQIVLVAESMRLPVPSGNVRGGVVGNFENVSGKIVTYAVNLAGVDNYDIKQTELSQSELYFSYNPTLLIPKSVSIGSSLINDIGNIVTFEEIQEGFLKVVIKHNDFNQIEYGNWLNLDFMGLAGNSQSTKVKLDSIIFTSLTEISYTETEEGEYTMIGECDVNGTRNLSIKTVAPLRFETGSLINKESDNLIFEVISNENSKVNIYNQYGDLVNKVIDNNLPFGFYKVPINFNSYPNGLYFIKFENGNRVENYKFILVK